LTIASLVAKENWQRIMYRMPNNSLLIMGFFIDVKKIK